MALSNFSRVGGGAGCPTALIEKGPKYTVGRWNQNRMNYLLFLDQCNFDRNTPPGGLE